MASEKGFTERSQDTLEVELFVEAKEKENECQCPPELSFGEAIRSRQTKRRAASTGDTEEDGNKVGDSVDPPGDPRVSDEVEVISVRH